MPKHFYQIVQGVVSADGEVIKPGDIVEWDEERAAAWYPGREGWIKEIPNPNPAPKSEPEKFTEAIEEHAEKEPEMVPAEQPADPEPTKELTPEPKTERVKPRNIGKKNGR